MKTVFNMKNLMIMKNYNKYICAFILLMGMNVSVWGVVTTAELNFGTAAVSETFEACTAGTQTTGSGSGTTTRSNMTSYGVFTHCYIGTTTESKFSIQGSASPMTSKYLQLENNKNTVGVGFTRSFASRGAFTFKIAKTSKAYIGLYTAAPNNNAIAKDNVAVFLNFTGSSIQIHNGSSGGWVNAVTSLPDDDVLEIAIVYNTSTATTYGNSIPLGANRAHIYVNGSAKMSEDVPQEFTIPSSRSLSFFNITYGQNTTTAKIDDIVIYDALPTKAGNTITLNKNNVDDGSTGGTGTILTDATSMTIDAAPTRTGYTVEGYYTAASNGVKIAAANGALQSNVTVSSTSWTNGSGVWQNVGDKTFYTYWSPIEYIIEYDKNNNAATGTMEDQEFVYGTAQNLSKCGFSREGYTFSGWATTADDSKEYDDEEEVNNLTSTEDDIITLYAKWTPNNYKLTVGTPSNVTIKATPEDKSDITEGNFDAAVPCDAIITLDAVVDAGYSQAGWKITKDADGSDVTTSYLYDRTTMFMPPFDVTVTATMYGDFVFSCSELTLTPHLATEETPIFITSTASKTVRSQDYIEITGSGLTPSTALTFPGLPSKFAIKKADGTAVTTDVNGEISAYAYIFYTPGAGDTSDGLDKLTGITVSVEGAKPKTVVLTQDIIGRHLPADFVIAAKYNRKWYALPADMTTGTPSPVEIAVDDADNPTTAYTATGNMYSLYDQAGGSGVKLAMQGQSNAPLAASSSNSIGKSSATIVTNPQADNYLWLFAQTNSEITTAATAKYTMKSVSPYNDYFVRLKENAGDPKWGQYLAGITEIRLIPAIAKDVREAYFIEYGQHGGIIEVDKVGMGAYYVKAKLKGNESPLTEFNQTLTSVLNGSTKYNYTVNFGDGIDFADADAVGKILTLEWYEDAENMVGVTTIELPKIIIASDATMTTISSSKRFWENLEVHVLPGATLTANANSFSSNNVTIKQLEIYPGAKVNVSTGTLNVTDLMLRNGWTRAGSKNYGAGKMVIEGSANLTHTNAYLDLYIDNDQYYPLAVPFPVTVEDIKYVYSTRAFTVGGPTGEIRLRYYDGEGRAAGNPFNWKFYGATDCLGVPVTLEPSKGYAIAVKRPTGKAFSIIRLPLTFDNAWTTGGEHGSVEIEETPYTKNTVHVNAYGDEKTKEADKGWNLIGNPYMGVFNGNDEEDFSGHLLAVKNKDNPEGDEKIRYVTMPNTSFTDYTQVNVTEANMQPYSSFLIQAKEDCDLVFNTSKIMPSLAPAQFRATPTRMSEQEAYIRLSNENGSDQMGLIIGEDYTAEYETNADLAKMHGELNTLKTYMVYDETDMAYVAINEELAKEWIPVSVRIPADGEYTFSLRNISVINELEGIYLNDSYTNAVINLIEQDYTFIAEAGTITERFSINAIAGHRDTPTEIDVLNAGGDIHGDKPVKFIWNDKVFIWLNGAIYDTTGKRVK